MNLVKRLIYIISTLSLIGTVFIYPKLPAVIPRHYNIRMQPDAWGSKNYIFITALLPFFIIFLLYLLPKIDPKRQAYQQHKKAFEATRLSVVLLLIIIHWIVILSILGFKQNMGAIILSLLGVMFIIMGNYMTQIKQNYTFGIRTPWTLANGEVWRRTHRVGGYIFASIGIITVILAIINSVIGFMVFIGLTICDVIFTLVYSYIIFKKLGNQDPQLIDSDNND